MRVDLQYNQRTAWDRSKERCHRSAPRETYHLTQ